MRWTLRSGRQKGRLPSRRFRAIRCWLEHGRPLHHSSATRAGRPKGGAAASTLDAKGQSASRLLLVAIILTHHSQHGRRNSIIVYIAATTNKLQRSPCGPSQVQDEAPHRLGRADA